MVHCKNETQLVTYNSRTRFWYPTPYICILAPVPVIVITMFVPVRKWVDVSRPGGKLFSVWLQRLLDILHCMRKYLKVGSTASAKSRNFAHE